jgi:hypothetical protein
MDEVNLKLSIVMFSTVFAYLGTVLLQLLGLPFDSFVTAFMGAFIGELYAGKSTFKSSICIIFGVAILTTWLGGIAVNFFELHHFNPVYGIAAFVLATKKEVVLKELDSNLGFIFKKIGSKIKDFFGG